MKYTRPFDWKDADYVAQNMRIEDVEECAASGFTPLRALTLSAESAISLRTLVDPEGNQAAVLGVSPSSFPRFGAVWMLGTPSIEKYKMTFLRNSKLSLPILYEETGYDALYNYTYANNSVHHAWLRWLGFTFFRNAELPPYKREFYEFIRLRDSHVY